MLMDAIVKPARQKGLELVRKEVPKINFGEALVKIRYTAICGTDVHIYDWNDWAQDTIVPPLTVGHEFVGEIVEIKGGDDSFKVGDLVSAEGHIVCGKCRNCRAGRRHLCPNTKGLGVNRDGIFAEYAAIPISNLWLCDKDIPEKYYAIFDPLGNATHTALKFGLVGEDVLITGAGPIGIMAAAIARHVGAKNVVITDINDDRLALAKEVCGKTITTVNTLATSLGEVQRSLGMREGFDVGLEMSGSGAALSDMIDNMIMGGKIALLGIQGKNAPVDWNKIIFNMLTLQGIYGREVFETWHKMTAMLKSGLDISKIITHEIKYEDFESGFAAMHGGKAGKVIMDWTK